MVKIFFTYCFLLLSSIGLSTSITGNTHKSFSGKVVNLIQFEDYITYEYEVISSTNVDTAGNFIFNHDIKETDQFIIQIEDLIGIIYLDPNKSYNIYFPPYSEDGTYKLTRNYTNIIFDSLNTDDVNGLILEFDRRLDQFFEDNINFLGSPLFKTKLDTLKSDLKTIYKDVKHEYFLKYIKYSVASLDLIATVRKQHVNRLSNYNVYIANKKVDLRHYAYMNFFHQFYEKELLTPSITPSNKILEAINIHQSYVALDSVLAKDYFFKMDKIRDLAILSNIFELYYDDRFNQGGMLEILNQMIETSKYDDIREIALNVKQSLTKMQVGYQALDFTLKDQNNEEVSLKDFKGKYVYINFWTTWSKESQAEMALYPQFIEKYGNHIEFVSINIDIKKSKFDNYVASHKESNWNLLYFNGNTNLLDDYKVNSIPHYILIDPDGFIVQNPAERPSPNGSYISIDKTFFDINKSLTKKKRWNIGGK